MTVETIGPMPLSESLAVRCVWFDNNGTIQKDTFWVEELVHVYDPNGNFVAPEI